MEKSKLPRITDEEIILIKSAQEGNEKSFNCIFYKYKGFVESLLTGYLKDRDEARDLTNIVFIKVHNKLKMFKDYDSFGGWLRILTRNTAIDYLRTIKDKQTYVASDDNKLNYQQANIQHETDLINQMTLDSVLEKLPNLSPIKRKVLTMYYTAGYSIGDISKCTGIPKGTIKSILFRFRKVVFKQLNLN